MFLHGTFYLPSAISRFSHQYFLRRGWPRRRRAHLSARRAVGPRARARRAASRPRAAPAACGCSGRHFLMVDCAWHCAFCRGSAEVRAFPAQWVSVERTGHARCSSLLQRESARTRLIAAQLLHKRSSGRATAPSYTAHNNQHNQTLSRCAAKLHASRAPGAPQRRAPPAPSPRRRRRPARTRARDCCCLAPGDPTAGCPQRERKALARRAARAPAGRAALSR